MICCDQCEEWYHGECVGISLAEGKKMEKLGVDYICTKCEGETIRVKKYRDASEGKCVCVCVCVCVYNSMCKCVCLALLCVIVGHKCTFTCRLGNELK